MYSDERKKDLFMNNIDTVDMDILKYERQDLESYIYEGHKDAFGSKGRHYNFDAMSIEDLRKEADWINKAVINAIDEENAATERALAEFKAQITSIIELGAGNRINALRWMTSTETFYLEQCVEAWVYNQGILFTDYGRELVKELVEIVTFEDAV